MTGTVDTETLVTFGLAMVAYTLLQVVLGAVLKPTDRWAPLAQRRFVLTWALWIFALAHSICIWTFRFDWDLGFAIDKGIPVFVAFHGALLIMTWLAFTAHKDVGPRKAAIALAWFLVASSAVVAPFKYPELTGLKIPVIGLTLCGIAICVSWFRFAAQKQSTTEGA